MLFICYPKCSTCMKAKKFLIDNNIKFLERDIKINNPNKDELKKWIEKYDISLKSLFNSSGLLYKSLNLKEKLIYMTLDEQLNLLSSNGMLVKRPILIADDKIIIGFKIDKYKELIK